MCCSAVICITCRHGFGPCLHAGAASGSADADKKDKTPKGGTAVKVPALILIIKLCYTDKPEMKSDVRRNI